MKTASLFIFVAFYGALCMADDPATRQPSPTIKEVDAGEWQIKTQSTKTNVEIPLPTPQEMEEAARFYQGTNADEKRIKRSHEIVQYLVDEARRRGKNDPGWTYEFFIRPQAGEAKASEYKLCGRFVFPRTFMEMIPCDLSAPGMRVYDVKTTDGKMYLIAGYCDCVSLVIFDVHGNANKDLQPIFLRKANWMSGTGQDSCCWARLTDVSGGRVCLSIWQRDTLQEWEVDGGKATLLKTRPYTRREKAEIAWSSRHDPESIKKYMVEMKPLMERLAKEANEKDIRRGCEIVSNREHPGPMLGVLTDDFEVVLLHAILRYMTPERLDNNDMRDLWVHAVQNFMRYPEEECVADLEPETRKLLGISGLADDLHQLVGDDRLLWGAMQLQFLKKMEEYVEWKQKSDPKAAAMVASDIGHVAEVILRKFPDNLLRKEVERFRNFQRGSADGTAPAGK